MTKIAFEQRMKLLLLLAFLHPLQAFLPLLLAFLLLLLELPLKGLWLVPALNYSKFKIILLTYSSSKTTFL
jgi:hypothetical protein